MQAAQRVVVEAASLNNTHCKFLDFIAFLACT